MILKKFFLSFVIIYRERESQLVTFIGLLVEYEFLRNLLLRKVPNFIIVHIMASCS